MSYVMAGSLAAPIAPLVYCFSAELVLMKGLYSIKRLKGEFEIMDEQIVRNNWKDYLNNFSQRNRMRPTRVEILSDEIGVNEQAQHLPLVGISYEEKGSDTGDVLVSLGDEGSVDARHLIHAISQVTSIALLQLCENSLQSSAPIAASADRAPHRYYRTEPRNQT
jgi:hypothetical protein